MGLNSSMNVCAAEYVGADKEKATKPDVVFLRAPVAPGCWAKPFEQSVMGTVNPDEQRVQSSGHHVYLNPKRPGEQ